MVTTPDNAQVTVEMLEKTLKDPALQTPENIQKIAAVADGLSDEQKQKMAAIIKEKDPEALKTAASIESHAAQAAKYAQIAENSPDIRNEALKLAQREAGEALKESRENPAAALVAREQLKQAGKSPDDLKANLEAMATGGSPESVAAVASYAGQKDRPGIGNKQDMEEVANNMAKLAQNETKLAANDIKMGAGDMAKGDQKAVEWRQHAAEWHEKQAAEYAKQAANANHVAGNGNESKNPVVKAAIDFDTAAQTSQNDPTNDAKKNEAVKAAAALAVAGSDSGDSHAKEQGKSAVPEHITSKAPPPPIVDKETTLVLQAQLREVKVNGASLYDNENKFHQGGKEDGIAGKETARALDNEIAKVQQENNITGTKEQKQEAILAAIQKDNPKLAAAMAQVMKTGELDKLNEKYHLKNPMDVTAEQVSSKTQTTPPQREQGQGRLSIA